MKPRWAPLLLLLLAACRQAVPVDTSGSRFIPRDLAVEELKRLLAKADYVACVEPRVTMTWREIREWAVDGDRLEARADGKAPVQVVFKDVTSARLDKYGVLYQVRLFTTAHPGPRSDYARIHWPTAEPARRAVELLDALRQKS